MKRILVVAGILAIVVFIVILVATPSPLISSTVVFLTSPPVEVEVEIADSPEERQVGLMWREELGENEGMLFIFEEEQVLGFWMKNTLISLDMFFINKDFEIVKIHTAVPCGADPCPTYSSGEQALYVVEVNGGFAGEKGIQEGERVEIIVQDEPRR